MAAARTMGMTLIAALSLFVGVSGLVGSTAVISDGLGLTRIGTVTGAPSIGTTSAPPPVARANGTVVAFGAIRGILSVMLLAGAIGTLWVRPSGRRFSLLFAVGWIVLGAVEPFALGYAFGWPVVTSALYPFLLLALFNSPSWRGSFSMRKLSGTTLVAVMITLAAPALGDAPEAPIPAPSLGVSPMLVSAAADVWSVIARPDNPVWPGWDASDTPLLLYLPGQQELLINHPHPPEGFRVYDGPLEFPGGRIAVRDGVTLVKADGQNTAMDVEGVRTLVVADPLSNLRQNMAGLIEDPRPAAEKVRTLEFTNLLADPYEQLALVVHEAFHVFQRRVAPDHGANEMLLLFYPVLSIENNVGFGLEASALAAAIDARDDEVFRTAACRWLAIRLERRRQLPARAIEYEDGTEFNEGLAKYTEFRLFQVLEGRTPSPELGRAQGFAGYGDLSFMRRQRVREMRRNLRGEVNINNDPYGAAPLRFRLYYSGMAIGLLLDRLSPGWKHDVIATDSSLTALARAALRATPEQLASALVEARADTAAATLRVAKTRLAADGRARNAAKLAALERGPGTKLVVDYSPLGSPRVALAFSPFGLTAVDSVRTLFEQAPISATFADGSELAQGVALPLLRDTRRRELSCRLGKAVSRTELERLLGQPLASRVPRPIRLSLPDVTLDMKRATVRWEPGAIRATLFPAPTDSTGP